MSKPEVISSEPIYKGRVFDIRVDTIREAQGGELHTYKREIISHNGSAVIVPLFEDGTVALVRQYRHAAGDHLLELPAGTLDHSEDPKLGAIRELEEEIGVTASSITKLTEFYVSPGFLTEKMHLYLATGLTETAQDLDDDEFLNIERIPLSDALNMVRTNRIQDAKTIIGLMLALNPLEK